MEEKKYGDQTLQIILDNIRSSIYVTDVETYDIIFANKFLKSQYDYDIQGKKCWDAVIGLDEPCPFCRLKEVVDQPIGTPLIWEHYNPPLDAWLDINETVVRWSNGCNAHLVVFNDITERKRNEQAVFEYKDKLEAMSDNLPNSFVFQLEEKENEIATISYISKGVEAICKISPEQLGTQIQPLLDLFYPEDLSMLFECATRKEAFNLEVRLTVPGIDETVWLMLSEIPRTGKGGCIIWDGIAMDITARKRVESELRRSQQELLHNAELMKEIGDNLVKSAIYRTHLTSEGKIKLDYATRQMEILTGIALEEIKKDLGVFIRNVHPGDIQNFVKRIIQTTAKLEDESTEFRYIKDGKQVWYKLQSAGFEQDGVVISDGLISDITEQKNLELQLIDARNKAEESDKLKSTFMANMSHEIRTPMNAIIGFMEFLTTEDDIDRDTQREYMRIVWDNANQLLKLIGDILDISKIDAGQMQIIPCSTDVKTMLNDIRTSFHASGAIDKGGEVDLITDSDSTDPIGVYMIDSVRLRQILNNLIGNAIKFTEKGHVKFGYRVVGNELSFFVSDTGIGISKQKQQELGKPFHQLHDIALSAKYGGTGIGLAISINLVKLMGGTFCVESELGKGSLFKFTIPRIYEH